MSELLQWAAAIVVLVAFGLSQWGVWSVASYRYLWFNFVGGAGLSAAATALLWLVALPPAPAEPPGMVE